MTATPANDRPSDGPDKNMSGRGQPGREKSERRCIATGESQPKAGLIRFVVGPDGTIGPDLAEKLPGRGIWVTGTREALDRAIAKKAFARAAKQQVTVPEGLADLIKRLLEARAAETLGLARRSGELIMGLERAFETLDREPVALMIEAVDAGRDGVRRLRAKLKAADFNDLPVVRGLSSAQMGLALGRSNVVHAALKTGRMQEKVLADFARLAAWNDQTDPGDVKE